MSGWLPGVILIGVGLTLFAVQLLHLDTDVVVLVLGLIFGMAFAATRRYGLLIPAGILTGLGAGIVLEDSGAKGEPALLGLGLGFLAIYAVDALTSGAREPGRWWPLIPGTITTVIAGASGTFGDEGARAIAQGWPIVLIALGAWLLVRRGTAS
jgi:hypothetical protein